MSNSTTWLNQNVAGSSEQKFAFANGTARLLIFALLLILAACALSLLQHAPALANMAVPIEKITPWIFVAGAAGALVGTLILLRTFSHFSTAQKEWSARIKSFEQLSAANSASLHNQIAGERRNVERLQKQYTELAERNTILEEELDKRKRAEK